jgi:hypothetical protein
VKLHSLQDAPEPALAQALADFEDGFTYPLGPGRWFRISHGEDYPRFFRAMGPARCFVAEQGGCVVGALAVAIRPLSFPDGSPRATAYIGDLKVAPGARGTWVFLRMARAADAWARPQVDSAYGIVMEGTRASPPEYSGRVGIPSFLKLGRVIVLRFPADRSSPHAAPTWATDPTQGEACYGTLSRGRYSASGGTPALRSEMTPLWLVHPDGLACGRLEDTRRAKRLIDSDGVEMLSAHLACFAWRTPRAGAELIHAARWQAALAGLPALFTAVPEQDLPPLETELGETERIIAPATVYGVGLQPGPAWNINSSEI